MWLDYRKVNQQLLADIHPLPKLEELVENVAGKKYFETLWISKTSIIRYC